MIYIILLIHLLLIIINFYISKYFLYPPTVFVSVWSIALFCLILLGDFFYPISEFTLLIFTLGAIAFSLGGFLVMLCSYKTSHYVNHHIGKLLDISLFLVIIMFPFYIWKLQELSALSGVDDFFIGLRTQTSGTKEKTGLGIFAYINSLAGFIALAAFSESLKFAYSKYKTALILLVAFSYGLMSTARTATILLLLSLACIYMLRRKLTLKTLLIITIIFIILFAVPAIILEKGGSKESSLSENLISLIENLQIYAFAGLIAFDQTVLHPGSISSGNGTFGFFLSLFKAFGFDIEIKSSVLEYSSTPWLTNVYTIYFPYYTDFGLYGLIAIMVLLGAIITIFYRLSILGDSAFIILYSIGFSSLIFSLFAESLFISLSYWIQTAILVYFFYKVRVRVF
ncbi:MAG: O-antigen polymerase [Methylococcales bacterium]